MKFFSALKKAEFCEQLFAAAGLNLDEIVAKGDATALKTHIDALKPSDELAVVTAELCSVKAENATLNAALGAAKKEIEEANATASAATKTAATYTAGLEAAGIKLSGTPAEAASVTAAINDKSALKARELLAKHGISEPIATAPAADPTKTAAKPAKEVTGLARVKAAFEAKATAGRN